MRYLYSIIVICVNNDSLMNNIYVTLQDLIFSFKIPIGTGKILFEIFGHFRHEPWKRFASPAVEY